jgi:arginine utilization regulatory protein
LQRRGSAPESLHGREEQTHSGREDRALALSGRPGGKSGESLLAARQMAEIEAIRSALRKTAGNQSLAARLLGVSPQLLYYKLKKFRILVTDFQPKGL